MSDFFAKLSTHEADVKSSLAGVKNVFRHVKKCLKKRVKKCEEHEL